MTLTAAIEISHPHASEPASVVDALGTNAHVGLSEARAAERLREVGRNEIVEAPGPSWWNRLLRQFQSPLVYLLAVAIVVSTLAWLLDGATGVPLDAIVIAAIMAANAWIGFLQEGRAATAVAELRRMVTHKTIVVRDGTNQEIPAAEVVPGDVLVLAAGDTVPADARVLQATVLAVAEAVLTGESEPVVKTPEAVAPDAALGDRVGMVYSATSVVAGSGRAVVTATGMATEVGGIATLLHETEHPPTPLERELERVGRTLGIAVVAITAIVVAASVAISGVGSADEAVELLLIGVSLAVAAVPEGLPAVLSLVLAMGVRRMADRNALLKRLAFAETLGATTVICTDKTGTLTRSEMSVQRLATAAGVFEFDGTGYEPTGAMRPAPGADTADGVGPDAGVASTALVAGVLCSDADIRSDDGSWSALGDPTEAALVAAAERAGLDVHALRSGNERVAELPFDSTRKRMTTVCRAIPDALTMYTKGAPDVILPLCDREQAGRSTRPLADADRERLAATVNDFADQALRTLALAYRPLAEHDAPDMVAALTSEDERRLILLGIVGIIDPPRPQVAAAVERAQSAGIRVVMITGDHPHTAARIAADVGIAAAPQPVVTGVELDKGIIGDAIGDTAVFSRVAPRHKLLLVEAFQEDGDVVAMTGDGVNDAPALKAADIGIAMGLTGSDVSRGAADMILTDDDFATIVAAVEEGRSIFANIAAFLRYLLSSNMGEVLTMFLGVVLATVIGLEAGDEGIIAPLAATQILWINLLTDTGPALALGVDPVDPAVMTRRPRRRDDRLIDAAMMRTIGSLGLTMALAALVMLDAKLPGGLIEGEGDFDTARTGAFTVLVLAQLFNAFNTRSEHRSAFHEMTSNHWLLATVALSFALQVVVVHLGPLNEAFSTAPLSVQDWLLCALLASSVLWVGEGRKILARRRKSAAITREPSGSRTRKRAQA